MKNKSQPWIILLCLLLLILLAACASAAAPAPAYLAFWQAAALTPSDSAFKGLPLPSERGALFSASGACASCHTHSLDQAGKDVSVDKAWSSSLHANAARDPYWLATVRSEVTLAPALSAAIQKKCATCHMPMAEVTLASDQQEVAILDGGLASPQNTLHPLAVDGVSCTLCHQIEPDGLGKPESFSGGYVVNTRLAQGQRVSYGPYPVDPVTAEVMRAVSGFIPRQGQHLTQSDLCGACHNLYTPYLDSAGKVAGEFPEQLIFSEWQNSAYAKSKTCQDCHMPAAQGGVKLSVTGGEPRQPFFQHGFTGGNAYLTRLLAQNGAALQVSAAPEPFSAALRASVNLVSTQSARLTLENPRLENNQLLAELLVESLTGHKFPAGFPSRRAWLHIRVLDKNGQVVFESGAVSQNGAVQGNDNDADPARYEPHYTLITLPDQVQIYEGILADSGGQVTTNLLRAASYGKDNRLLPAGFKASAQLPQLNPQGEAAKDENFTAGSDRLGLRLDLGKAQAPFTLEVRLLYQSIAYRWAENLAKEKGSEVADFKKVYDALPNLPLTAASAQAEVK